MIINTERLTLAKLIANLLMHEHFCKYEADYLDVGINTDVQGLGVFGSRWHPCSQHLQALTS